MDSVDSYKRRTCPHYPQPYDDGVPLLRGPSALPEDHNKHSLKWYILWGKPQPPPTRQILDRCPGVKVIILTTFDDDEYVFDGLLAGAAGYLLKDVPSEQLAEAIRAAARGEAFIHPSVTSKVVAELTRLTKREHVRLKQPLVEPLSQRELEVLALVGEGLSNQEIAGRLFIAPGTVKNHVSNILSKLNARDRTQAVLQARDLGLL